METMSFKISVPVWPITEMTGYEPKTTFWSDFSIADKFGINAVKDTFRRAFKGWRNDVVYITELAMVLNHKMWQHNQRNQALAMTYQDLWEEVEIWASENLTGDDANYYYRTLD